MTKTVLDWLSSQGSPSATLSSEGTFRNTRAIVDCARSLPPEHRIPSLATDALHQAIKARRRVHGWYKQHVTAPGITPALDADKAHEALPFEGVQGIHMLKPRRFRTEIAGAAVTFEFRSAVTCGTETSLTSLPSCFKGFAACPAFEIVGHGCVAFYVDGASR